MNDTRRLFAFYAPAFSFGLAVEAPSPDTPVECTGAEAQQRMRRLLERAGAAARAAGKPARDVDSAAFAIAAWFDEIAARHAGWADAAAPLQLQLFNSTNAATEFFHHLAGLQAWQGELREIYWYALALGFQGQYYFEAGSRQGEPAKLLALHATQLPLPPVDLRSPGPLCPQLQVQALPPAPPPRPHRASLARRAAAGALLALPLLWGAAAWLYGGRSPDLAEHVTQQLQHHACAMLQAERQPDGSLRIQGFVPKADDLQRVRDEVAALAGATPAAFDLQLRPWPYCEVVAILQPHRMRGQQARQGLQISAPDAPGGALREGERVRLQVRAPDHEGVLWVDYYTADGAVLHLLADGQRRVRFGPGERLVFGEDLPSSWLVSPPFGTVLVTAVALPSTQAALPAAEPAAYELASAYLLRLREMLAAAGTATPPSAEWLFLQTRER